MHHKQVRFPRSILRVEEETVKTSLETQIIAGALSNQDRRDLSSAGRTLLSLSEMRLGNFLWLDACAEASCGFESLDGRILFCVLSL
jgi:hypothetical protein